MSLDGLTMDVLERALQVADLRQQVYSTNIANANTPGYKAEHVSFEVTLRSAVSKPNGGTDFGASHIPISVSGSGIVSSASQWLGQTPAITASSDTSVENDGNNVNLDSQMAKMAANQIRYNALVQDMQLRFQRLETAIVGG